jgi:hypothetical protein
MRIPVFLSYPNPHLQAQQVFIDQLREYLQGRGLEPRTLGVTDYDMSAPLTAIRRLMIESNGLITVALRRTEIRDAMVNAGADVPGRPERPMQGAWYTSAYCQIEPAMAYQLGLPILILREKGVLEEGLLEKGVLGLFMPEFDLSNIDGYFQSPQWTGIIGKWEGLVRAVVEAKGQPPRLY